MIAREIHRDQWFSFLAGFSRQHGGWLVVLEVFDSESCAQIEAIELSLGNISAELGEVDPPEGELSVLVGGEQGGVAHAIRDVQRITLRQGDDGSDQALAIESSSGITTIVRLRSVIRGGEEVEEET